MKDLRERVETAWRGEASATEAWDAAREAVGVLDRGEARVAEKVDGIWQVNEWLKHAILLYFRHAPMETIEAVSYTHLTLPTIYSV